MKSGQFASRTRGWISNYKKSLALALVVTVATLQIRDRFFDRVYNSLAEGAELVIDALGDAVGQGVRCVFGTINHFESEEWTVSWPVADRTKDCSCKDDEFHRSWVWPSFKENEQ